MNCTSPLNYLRQIHKAKSFTGRNGRFPPDSPKSWLDFGVPATSFIVNEESSKDPFRFSEESVEYTDSNINISSDDSFKLILPPIGKRALKPIRKLNSFRKISVIPDALR